jgi:hypothetical protein
MDQSNRFFSDVIALEAGITADIGELRDQVAPLATLTKRVLQVSRRLDQLDDMLRGLSVSAVVGTDTLIEVEKVRKRVARHEQESKRLREELGLLKGTVRSNAEKQAALESVQLMGDGVGEQAKKKGLLRTAETGTGALREAAAAMRQEVERMHAAKLETDVVSDLIKGATTQSHELQGGLSIGRGLITRLERRDFTDRVVIGFAFAIFVIVCGYIFKGKSDVVLYVLCSSFFGQYDISFDSNMTIRSFF